MGHIKILILGNDHNINDIDFDRIRKNRKLITIGLNRIWHKFIPDYLFFNDIIILHELMKKPEIFGKCKLITSQYIYKKGTNHLVDQLVHEGKLKVYKKVIKSKSNYSSVSAITIAQTRIFPQKHCTFYLAGISLQYNPLLNHFWEDKKRKTMIEDKHLTANWHIPRLYDQTNILKSLKDKYTIISVTPKSRLNGYYEYQNIKSLYK
jgi:hypothetical protein